MGYWDGGEWWGAGPGAHGYVGVDAMVECQASQRICASSGRRAAAGGRFRGARRHGDAHRGRDAADAVAARAAGRRAERSGASTAPQTAVADGLLRADGDRLVLTDRGRLLADAVVRTVLD